MEMVTLAPRVKGNIVKTEKRLCLSGGDLKGEVADWNSFLFCFVFVLFCSVLFIWYTYSCCHFKIGTTQLIGEGRGWG